MELKESSLNKCQYPLRAYLAAANIPSRYHRAHGVRFETIYDNLHDPHVGDCRRRRSPC
jgi:hypothetical protein